MRRVFLLACFLSATAFAQEGQGFAEVRVSAFPGADGKLVQVVERVRPSLKQEITERISLVATVEAGFAQGRDQREETERELRPTDLWPFVARFERPPSENQLLRINGSDDYLDVDRLYLDFYGESFDLRFGRQALNWGSGQFFNPTDPFPEVLLAEPWRPRRGVNSVRLNVPFGEVHDVTAVVATNDTIQEVRAAARVRFNWKETDFALVSAWRGENRNVVLGVDLRGTFGVGWWIEAAYLVGYTPHEEVTVGIDYSFPILERAVVFAQFYRNGGGLSEVDIPALLSSLASGGGVRFLPTGEERDSFAPFVLGQNYGLLGATLGFTPELTANLAVLQSFNDGSGMAIPTVNYAVLDWLEVAGSAQVPYSLTGSSGEFKFYRRDLNLRFPHPVTKQVLTADLRGLFPAATITLWSRASF